MADEGAEKKVRVKKEREPIAFFCSIILLVACIGVAGAYISEEFTTSDSVAATEGSSKITCDYYLSFYDYYDRGGVVYQTTTDIGDGYVLSPGYTKSGLFTVDMSKDDVLSAFKDALVGAKAGQEIRVSIAAANAYSNPCDFGTVSPADITMKVNDSISKAEFKEKYGMEPKGNGSLDSKDFGWKVNYYVTNTNMVKIQNAPVAGETYNVKYGGLDINFKVNGVTATEIKYSLTVSDDWNVKNLEDDNVTETSTYSYGGKDYTPMKMVKLAIASGDVNKYVLAVAYDASEIVYKVCGESFNQDLYFVIKVASVE